MISRDDLQPLLERPAHGHQVLSLFLDMSVNSDNKRTHDVFLSRQESSFKELSSDRPGHHREEIGEALARVRHWLQEEYDEANKGVALYVELGGDWSRGFQLPLPLGNRLTIADRPIVTPLAEVVNRYHHHGVIVVDREHLRLLSFYLDQTEHERSVDTEPFPAAHDIQRGGFSARDYQSRKAEETKHFFKEFCREVDDFVRSHRPHDLTLLGTQENVTRFRDCLPDALQAKIIHTDRMEIDATPAEIRRKLAGVFERVLQEEEARAIDLLHDRVETSHKAVAGFPDTLQRLQEGKIATLVVARGLDRAGGRCQRCEFVLDRTSGSCPYCGGDVRDGINLVEEMVRIAEEQTVPIDFVASAAVEDIGGVGALLRF